jgi:nitrite reductase (NAD(P)H)
MFYIRTADKLQRTARWIESLPGGLKYLQEVVLEDKLGICASLEAQMQELVDSFFDEWAEAIGNPAIAAKFKQFSNTAESVENMEVERERGQTRPVMWSKDAATEDFKGLKDQWTSTTWQPVIEASHFAGADAIPNGISATIKRGDTQLALWRVRGKYYATQQMCPHKRAFILSDGLIGQDITATENSATSQAKPSPWVSCPHHKRNFDLGSGSCKTDSDLSIATFEVEERPGEGLVYIKLPPVEELDRELGTKRWMVKQGESGESQLAALDQKINFKGHRATKPGTKPLMDLPMRRPVEVLAGGVGCGGVGMDW